VHRRLPIPTVAAQLAELAVLLRAGNHTDPEHETVLCLVECASHAAEALSVAGNDNTVRHFEDALAAARAAVTCASFALFDRVRPVPSPARPGALYIPREITT
jgi:hypothetical protein